MSMFLLKTNDNIFKIKLNIDWEKLSNIGKEIEDNCVMITDVQKRVYGYYNYSDSRRYKNFKAKTVQESGNMSLLGHDWQPDITDVSYVLYDRPKLLDAIEDAITYNNIWTLLEYDSEEEDMEEAIKITLNALAQTRANNANHFKMNKSTYSEKTSWDDVMKLIGDLISLIQEDKINNEKKDNIFKTEAMSEKEQNHIIKIPTKSAKDYVLQIRDCVTFTVQDYISLSVIEQVAAFQPNIINYKYINNIVKIEDCSYIFQAQILKAINNAELQSLEDYNIKDQKPVKTKIKI